MKPTHAPPSRLCHECKQPVQAHKDSIFVVQDGEKRLYHNGCYATWRKNTIKQLRQEARAQGERKRLATPCMTCSQRRTRIFVGSFDTPHIRVCVNGHYQMERLTDDGGRTKISEYAAVVWKSNTYAWHGVGPGAQVVCTACLESIARADGMTHVLEKHAEPPQDEVIEEAAPVEVTPIVPQATVEKLQEVHVEQVVHEVPQTQKPSDLSLDDLLVELASRISTRISNLEQATQQANKVTVDLKVLVEQLLRGGR